MGQALCVGNGLFADASVRGTISRIPNNTSDDGTCMGVVGTDSGRVEKSSKEDYGGVLQ